MMRPRPSPMGSATPRPPTPAASTKPHGTSSASGPSSLAGNQCPPSPGQSPSTSATWPQRARPSPPSRRSEPRSPTPMPPRAYRRAITPPAIQPWSRFLKGWRNQAPVAKQADALTTDALARIRETARLPRRGRGSRTETTALAQARVTVDLAIIGVMADAGLRRSEAAAPTCVNGAEILGHWGGGIVCH